LFAPDLLEQAMAEELAGQRPRDFGLKGARRLTDEISAVLTGAKELWSELHRALERRPATEDDPGTSITREKWVIPFLNSLGYQLKFNQQSYKLGGMSFAISHRAGESPDAPPVHIVGIGQELGRRPKSGRPRMSPHALVQEYLNRSDALWGLVTNGYTLRLLRNSTYIRRQCYLEFDLRAIFADEHLYQDFSVLYRLLHRSRLPASAADAHRCLLERYFQHSVEQGGRVRDHLRDGVEQCIQLLADGFLCHPHNAGLREMVRAADDGGPRLSAGNLYQQLLRLVYRFLFLFVSEDRGLMSDDRLYREHYGVSRLRRLVDDRAAYNEHDDLWLSLRVLWKILAADKPIPLLQDRPMASLLGLPVLNGELFARITLDECRITNRDLLSALRHLVNYREKPSAPPRRVNYGALDVEELGSVYESLLDFHPRIDDQGGVPRFRLSFGSERKSTGSYYTPAELVSEVVRSALDPVIEERLQRAERQAAAAGGEWEALPPDVRRRFRELTARTPPENGGKPPAEGRRSPSAHDEGAPSRTAVSTEAAPESGPPREADLAVLWRQAQPSQRKAAFAESALLSIKILDPACGSGHFLLAAARRLGKELARVRTGEEEPAPEAVREAVRAVISQCIYGVDKNPLAVELCRVSLWLEAHTPGKPLTFLEHRIRYGDSLVGLLDLEILLEGIPNDAFKRVSGDDRRLVASLRKLNRQEVHGQGNLFLSYDSSATIRELADEDLNLDSMPDDSPAAIRKKRRAYERMRNQSHWARTAANIWVSAYFQPRDGSVPNAGLITTATLFQWLLRQPVHPQALAQVEALSVRKEHPFFHWPLEFPSVFQKREDTESQRQTVGSAAGPGFDVVLGNPPWERIKLQEKEFFATRDPDIATARNAAARKQLISELEWKDPDLWRAYRQALQAAEGTSRFLRASGLYPLSARGDINTYSVFAERMWRLLRPGGRAGIIVPTGIATDDNNKRFFAALMESQSLVSLYDFENRERIFADVDSRTKFCLLTMTSPGGGRRQPTAPRFAFFCTRAEHLRDERRTFTLTQAEIDRINPNTRTVPVFRTRQDALLTAAIYKGVPVLVDERRGRNPWGVKFMRMFDMSNDSDLFLTADELRVQGCRLLGNRYVNEDEELFLPLYEAKMIWQYDHRFGTYEGVTARSSSHLPTPSEEEHADPSFLVKPWYWVEQWRVLEKLGFPDRVWMLGFRDITNATNERTAIFSIIPMAGVGNTSPLILFSSGLSPVLIPLLLANLNSLLFDYVVRQKIVGTHLTYNYLLQLPVIPPLAYQSDGLLWLVPRVCELTYTAWDVKELFDDVWESSEASSPSLRKAIERQWEENLEATGGCRLNPPEWSDAFPEVGLDRGIPFPPFRWDEERRARLRAELDAWYARLYGLTRKQLRYILDPADLTPRELEDILDSKEEVADPLDPDGYAERRGSSEFFGETFRVLRDKEERRYGEYRTRRLVLEAWARLSAPGAGRES
jgi:hypothetical protein